MDSSQGDSRICICIQQFLKQLIILLTTLLIVAFLPVTLVLILAAYTFRSFLVFYVKHFKPELGKILGLRSTIFATDLPNARSNTTVIAPAVFSGRINIDNFKQDALEKVVMVKDDQGRLKYPELQQSMSFFCGYPFWKWDKRFDIANHILDGYKNQRILDKDGLQNISSELMRRPFNSAQSPWEMYLFSEYCNSPSEKSPKCLVLLRFSHCLVDGVSLMKIISSSSSIPLDAPKGGTTSMNPGVKWLLRFLKLLFLPYDLTSVVYSGYADINTFHIQQDKLSFPVVVRLSDPIPISLVKRAKHKLNSSFGGISLLFISQSTLL